MSSDYDGQDLEYQLLLTENTMLLNENEMLLDYLQNIAAIIYYQTSLIDQDRWLATMIERGIYIVEDDEE